MKKRRIAIVAFLLCATLVLGIGYAALSDQLNITGTATYRPTSVVNDRVDAAIKFTNAVADAKYCTAANFSGDAADMTVLINDINDGTTKFEAVATFTVTYDSTDKTYPAVKLNPISKITAGVGDASLVPGYSISTSVVYDNAEDAAAGALTAGNTATVTVTVIYDTTVVGTVPTAPVTAAIGVVLNCETQDVTVNP